MNDFQIKPSLHWSLSDPSTPISEHLDNSAAMIKALVEWQIELIRRSEIEKTDKEEPPCDALFAAQTV